MPVAHSKINIKFLLFLLKEEVLYDRRLLVKLSLLVERDPNSEI